MKISRDEARMLIAKSLLPNLSGEEREDLLVDWWSIDVTDSEFQLLPIDLQREVTGNGQWRDPRDARYDTLISVAIADRYRGVSEAYLKKCLKRLGVVNPQIVGEHEPMHVCPCCGYMTLADRGEYEVCPACFWEDDGTDDPNQYSLPNRLKLAEGQANFRRIGACSQRFVSHVDSEAAEKYFCVREDLLREDLLREDL